MRRLILPCALALSLATPSLAQEAEEPSLMERGLSMFFEGLIGEVARNRPVGTACLMAG